MAGSNLNEILYQKNLYDKAKAEGNTAGTAYAQKQAQTYYSGMNPAEAAKVQGMSAAQLSDYIKGGTTTSLPKAGDSFLGGAGAGAAGAGVPSGQLSGVNQGTGMDPNGIPAWFQQYLDGQKKPEDTGPSATDQLMKQLMEMLNSGPDQNELQRQADEKAQKQADEQRSSYQRLIDALLGNQSSEMESVNAGVANSKQSLENSSFQNFLQARQQMANRGLAGSGLADDQNTRLMLANGQALAGIGRDAEAKISGINANYGNKLAEANAQLSGVNQNEMANDIYSKLFDSGNNAINDKAKLYLDLIGKTIGYDKLSASDSANLQFKYDQLSSQDKQFYDKLNADQKTEYAKMGLQDRQFYTKLNSDQQTEFAKMNTQDRQFYSKLDADSRQFYDKLSADYGVELSKVMGVDAKGNPTLDMLKLNEEIRKNKANNEFDYTKLDAQVIQWTAQNGLEGSKIALSRDALIQKTNYDNAMIQKAMSGTQNEVDKTVLSGYKTQLDAIGQRLKDKSSKLAAGETIPANDNDLVQYNRLLDQIGNLVNPKGNVSGGASTTGTYNPSYDASRGVSGGYANEINAASKKYDIDPALVKAVATQESSLGQSSKNVMQVNGMNNSSPQDSIDKGTSMLSSYVKKYGSIEKALAAYNMGPGVLDYMAKNNITNVRDGMAKFSAYQKDKYGYKVYGDPQYIDHVLRYMK